jgi:uncharacterized protein involved in cysteine biosynthesis
MGISDFFRPKYRHSDVRVRTEAVKALGVDDAAILEQVARTDRDIGVRRLAIEKIDAAEVLSSLVADETERSLRELINARAAELWTSRACSPDLEVATPALQGIIKLGEQRALVDVIVRAQNAQVRKRAFGEIRDPKALAELTRSDAAQEIKLEAVARIDDGDVLRALAIDTTQKEIGLAAVERIDDADRLDNIAQKAKNKAVRQKARKIVGEINAAQAEAAKAPTVPDDVKRRRAEKAQLLREVEGVADSFDFAAASEKVKAAEAAWAQLGGTDDKDAKFTKAVARFWRRKEVHDSQARSAEELRVVEREAEAERARAAEARAPRRGSAEDRDDAHGRQPERRAQDAAEELVRTPEDELKREERERQRAEDEAKKAARAAERAARDKELAARAVAIAASLEAMLGEMEQLVADAKPDGKAVDRVLAQSAKAFEDIGKVAADARDKLAERYHAARGKLVIKASERREAEDWLRWQNVAKAEELIKTAKEWAAGAATPDLGQRLKGLQALWKEVGPMPQRRSKELWEAFKAECDKVYDLVKGVRAVEAERFAEVSKAKEALIAEAEALSDSTDFAATAEKLKALQAQWKGSGHLPRKQGDELWKRFRAACDKFFERRKPLLDARAAEEGENLAKKQALIARAQQVADKAGEGTWGKAIGEIKDLQREWKEIGFVPRRDADAVYKAFRTACDALFAKRDAARDAEANAHHAEVDAVEAEIAEVLAGGDDVVARAIAVRGKARELGVLGAKVSAMVAHVVGAHPDAVKGTELDPAQLKARRDKLIARAEELLPKQPPQAAAGGDVAAQLKAAMQKNAFGDLRFSGRDPIEVVDELRASWAEAGPILDDDDRAQAARFEDTCTRVLDAAGAQPRPERRRRGDRSAPMVDRDVYTAETRPVTVPTVRGPESPEPAAITEIVATPAVLTVALLVVTIGWVLSALSAPIAAVSAVVPGGWLDNVLEIAATIVLAIGSLAVFASVSSVIASPFNELLSEAVEERVTGVPGPRFRVRTFLYDLVLGMLHASRRAIVYLLEMLALLVIGLVVPVVGTIAAMVGGGYVTARFASYDAYDAVWARRHWRYRAKTRYLQAHAARTLGLGGVVAVILLVPGVNVIGLAIGATGATLRMLDAQRA